MRRLKKAFKIRQKTELSRIFTLILTSSRVSLASTPISVFILLLVYCCFMHLHIYLELMDNSSKIDMANDNNLHSSFILRLPVTRYLWPVTRHSWPMTCILAPPSIFLEVDCPHLHRQIMHFKCTFCDHICIGYLDFNKLAMCWISHSHFFSIMLFVLPLRTGAQHI